MKGKKVYLIIQSFSKKEMQQFSDFVQSPYFNKNPQLSLLTAHLARIHPEFSPDIFELSALPPNLLIDEALTEKKIAYLLTNLYQLIEKFLIHARMDTKEYLSQYHLVNELMKRGLDTLYEPLLKSLRKKLNQPYYHNKEQFTLKYLTADLAASFTNNSPAERDALLQESIDQLLEFYQVNILRYGHEMHSRKYVQSTDNVELPFVQKLEEYLEDNEPHNPIIKIYYRLYLLAKYPEEEGQFTRLLELIQVYQEKIGTLELKTIYLSTINQSLRKMRLAPEKYTKVTLDLYQQGIDNNALIEDGQLSQWTFTNTVKLALRAAQYDWAEGFINSYYHLLPAAERKNALALNQAELAFATGHPAKALDYLQDVKTSNSRYHILENIIRIKCLWETEEYQSALSTLASFKVYLSRAKDMAPQIKKSCQNFCQLLHRISVKGSEKKCQETKERILSTRLLAEKKWLLHTFYKENPNLK